MNTPWAKHKADVWLSVRQNNGGMKACQGSARRAR
ncbi:MAG: hypothetical protein LZF86_60006 [Nitrospira sp.]|nr:MAG: hypothetical protein LZF86_60006 [Nitrospira sp.]